MDNGEMDPVGENLDGVLRKYGKIWIWSILSVAAAGFSGRAFLSGTFAVTQFTLRVNTVSSVLAVVALAHAVATVVAVWYLLVFLRHHIVPVMFPDSTVTGPEGTVAPDGGVLLCRAFGAVVVGIAAEVVVVAMQLFGAMNGGLGMR
jgi:hypothetical protein